MRKLTKKHKPTQAEYFQSESQRKRTGKTSFIYGSKQIVAVLTILVIGSVVSGIFITQRSNDSEAGTTTVQKEWAVGSANGYGKNISNTAGLSWGYQKGLTQATGSNNTNQNLKISYPKDSKTNKGQFACWQLSVPSDITVNRIKVNLKSNAAGSTTVKVRRNLDVIHSFNRASASDLVKVDKAVSPSPGGNISVCHEVTDNGQSPRQVTFGAERYVYVNDYAVFGTKTTVVNTPATEPTQTPSTETSSTPIPTFVKRIVFDPERVQAIPGRITEVNEDGRQAERYEIVSGENPLARSNPGNPSVRAEWLPGHPVEKGAEEWYTWETKFADGFTADNIPQWANFTQWHHAGSCCGVPLQFMVGREGYNGSYGLTLRSKQTNSDTPKYYDLGAIEPGKWHKFEFHVKWGESSNTGFFELYKDGRLTITKQNRATMYPGEGNYMKQGLYRDEGIKQPQVVYHSGLTVSNGRLGSPGSSPAPAPQPAPTPTPSPTTPSPTPAPAPTPSAPAVKVIDQNRWSSWGFPAIPRARASEPLVRHGNNASLTIGYLANKQYTKGLTGCWTQVVAGNNTATRLDARIKSNDAGANYIIFKATGNSDYRVSRAADGWHRWKFPKEVKPGGTVSICNVVNPAASGKFTEDKNLTVSSYQIYGYGQRITDNRLDSVDISLPASSNASGMLTINATASDSSGISNVVYKNGSNILSKALATPPYQFKLDTRKYKNGPFKITAQAQDKAGNYGLSREVTINIKNSTSGSTPAQNDDGREPPLSSSETPTTCQNISVTEAEDGVRKGVTNTASDPLHRERKSAVLFNSGSYVECTLKAPKDGDYGLGAIVRSANYKGVAEAKISMAGSGQVASRTFEARSDQNYGLIRFDARKSGYRYLKQGEPVVVRVTFTNDAYGGNRSKDRNLWVDKIMLIDVSSETSDNSNQPQDETSSDNGILPCNGPNGSIEAEEATKKGAKTINDSRASKKQAVRLSTNDQYIECTLRATEKANYVLGGVMKSDNRIGAGRAEVKLSMAGSDKGVQSDTRKTGGAYSKIRMRGQTNNTVNSRPMEAGELVVVRVSTTNASSNVLRKRHAIVDNLELVKVGTPRPTETPASPENEPEISGKTKPQEGAARTTYSSATGGVLVKVEAEKSGHTGSIIGDSKASAKKAVRLSSNKAYVEYDIDFPETDAYSLDFYAKSEDFDGPAKAKIYIDGKAILQGTTTLEEGDRFRYYSSKRKVIVQKGVHNFKVEFINDKQNDDKDRNLIIDFLRVRGTKQAIPIAAPGSVPGGQGTTILEDLEPGVQVIEAENGTKCRANKKKVPCESKTVNDSNAYGLRALILKHERDFVEAEFIAPSDGKYTLGASIKSMDFEGSAHARIFIDGRRVDQAIVSTSGNFATVSYEKDLKANTRHKIRVVYINDKCGGESGPCNSENDRNLIVDQFILSPFGDLLPTPSNPNDSSPTNTTTPVTTPSPVSSTTVGSYERPCPASALYEKIPASEPKKSNNISAGMLAHARGANSDRGPTITGQGISPVRWQGTTSDPVWTQTAGGTSHKMYAPNNIFGAGIPDDTIEIYNQTTPGGQAGKITRQWGGDSVELNINQSAKTIRSSTIGAANINGDCVAQGTGTAWGLMSVMGVVLRSDWEEGYIDHAIGISLGNDILSPTKFIPPANRSEQKSRGTLVPMGTRLCHTYSDSEINNAQSIAGLSGNTLKMSDMLWKALSCSEYGFIVRDGTNDKGFVVYMDNPYHWQGSGVSEDNFRSAIRLSSLYNDANRWKTPDRSDY